MKFHRTVPVGRDLPLQTGYPTLLEMDLAHHDLHSRLLPRATTDEGTDEWRHGKPACITNVV